MGPGKGKATFPLGRVVASRGRCPSLTSPPLPLPSPLTKGQLAETPRASCASLPGAERTALGAVCWELASCTHLPPHLALPSMTQPQPVGSCPASPPPSPALRLFSNLPVLCPVAGPLTQSQIAAPSSSQHLPLAAAWPPTLVSSVPGGLGS